MIRVNVVAEGKSELHCVKGPLNRYLGGKPILDSRCVLTSRAHGATREYRGGLVSYQKAKKDIVSWLKEDAQAYVTTMFDFSVFQSISQNMRKPCNLAVIWMRFLP